MFSWFMAITGGWIPTLATAYEHIIRNLWTVYTALFG